MRRKVAVMSFLVAVLLSLASPAVAQDSVKVEVRTRQVPVTDSIITKFYSTTKPPVDTVKPPVPGSIAAVTVDPIAVSLAAGGKATFKATGWPFPPASGPVPAPNLKWTATGGTITSGGVFTAGSVAGSYAVTATSGTVFSTASVAVTGVVQPPVGESACLATDLLCEDFEDGWYTKNCDVANASGGLASQDGWCGDIYNAVLLAAGTWRCGNVGVRSNCAATSGNLQSGTTGNQADKTLARAVTEFRMRLYVKPLAGYQFGAEKMFTFNKGTAGVGGIWAGDLSWNCASSTQATGQITMGTPSPDRCARVANFPITPGNWYFYEVHYKINDPGAANGVFELWADNCGPTGTTCPSTPTKRLDLRDIAINRTANDKFRSIWFQAWSNPQSRGERYLDRIRVVEGNIPVGF